MRVELEYDVPVSARVNVDTGEVESVYVWRDAIEQRDDEYAIATVERGEPVSEDLRARAQEIAQRAVWPEWEFG